MFLITSEQSHKPLTLEQFEARTKELAGELDLFQSLQTPQRLFGYRLQANQLILG
ncbi:hypothetical protein M3M39_04075 [Fructilactobacillus hinvesii]|uniref:Uncharacterized protein n=1 Tax=Fructilactobacillus hinvesii TaxID=2940300 RepID=A0ABY5BQE9_9LACO|nr:hypothetical protein [Fructilactobacillus hinvesii]USS87307.1 hypothetical protein M3M39_04075 [Fructilactobacillus hinvesii]